MEQTENGAEKERNHQGDISEQVLRERKKLSSVSLMFFTISFLGWCMEWFFVPPALRVFTIEDF